MDTPRVLLGPWTLSRGLNLDAPLNLLLGHSSERAQVILRAASIPTDENSWDDPETLGCLVTTLSSLPPEDLRIIEQLVADYFHCSNDSQRDAIKIELSRFFDAHQSNRESIEGLVELYFRCHSDAERSNAKLAIAAYLGGLTEQRHAVDELVEKCFERAESADGIKAELISFLDRCGNGPHTFETIAAASIDFGDYAIYRHKIGNLIRKKRQSRHFSQARLAEETAKVSPPGLSQSHISMLERGQYVPTYKTVEKLAAALGCDMSDIDPTRL